jgi:hypothetical protein
VERATRYTTYKLQPHCNALQGDLLQRISLQRASLAGFREDVQIYRQLFDHPLVDPGLLSGCHKICTCGPWRCHERGNLASDKGERLDGCRLAWNAQRSDLEIYGRADMAHYTPICPHYVWAGLVTDSRKRVAWWPSVSIVSPLIAPCNAPTSTRRT